MANIKISAAADAGALLSSDMLPLARSGDTNAYHATMAEISTFASATVSSGAYGNVGRNLLHNALFNVAQRGAGPFTTANNMTLDRWKNNFSADAVSISRIALSDADRAAIGDEAASYAFQNVFTGTTGAGAYTFVTQGIEGVRRLAGKTVTLSFWGRATSGTPKLGLNIMQSFGSGGSPSPSLWATGSSVTLSTTWTRYTTTIAMPSATGKTLGTNGDDYSALGIWYSAGSGQNANAGNIGVQSGTVQLWGVQLEVGAQATQLEKPDPQQDLAKCQRFFLGQAYFQLWGYTTSGSGLGSSYAFPTTMRVIPTLTPTFTTQVNCVGSTQALNAGFYQVYTTSVPATGAVNLAGTFTASADL